MTRNVWEKKNELDDHGDDDDATDVAFMNINFFSAVFISRQSAIIRVII